MASVADVRSRLGPLTGALVVLAPLSQLGFVPVSAVLGDRLGIDAAAIGLAIGLYAAAAAVATLVLGPVFDLVPARRIFPVAVVANLIASVAMMWAPTLSMLIIGRVLAGIANSALTLSASVIVADAFRDEPLLRDRAFSGMQTFVSTGAISGLALGSIAAGFGAPWLYFATVAAYAVVILCLAPAILTRIRSFESPAQHPIAVGGTHAGEPAGAAVSSRRRLAADLKALLRMPRTTLLLVSTLCASVVLQGGHFGVSMLMNDDQPSVVVRALLTVMIPIGVLTGALVNQWSLTRLPPRRLYGRAYALLPLVCAVLAGLFALDSRLAWAFGLLCVGSVCGMLGPLQPAIMVGWFPAIRGSGAAAVSVANLAGGAVGPMGLGVIALAWTLPGAMAALAAIAAGGAVLAVLLARGRDPQPAAA